MTRFHWMAAALVLTLFVTTGCSRSKPAAKATAPATTAPKAKVTAVLPTASVEPVSETVAKPVSSQTPLVSLPPPPTEPSSAAASSAANTSATPVGDPPLLPVSTTTTTTTVTTEEPLQPLAASAPLATAASSPIVSEQPIAAPALQPEFITPEPSQEHVWIPGAWERTADQWQWVAGHWTKAPFGNSRWVSGYWKYDVGGKYVWSAGHWAATAPGQGMVVDKPLVAPPLPVEPAPVAPPAPPQPDYSWVPAHWDWTGYGWSFVAGHFTQTPGPQAEYIAGHWKQGLFGQWRWIAGHWTTK